MYHHQQPQQQQLPLQQQQQQQQQQPLMSSSQSMQNVNEFTGGYQNGSLEYRRSQLHDPATLYELQQQQLQQQQQQQPSPNFIALPPKPLGSLQSPNKPNAPPSTAPKPQQQQQRYLGQPLLAEDKPPLPPTATHPLFKATQQIAPGMNYVASTLDPPKGSYVASSQANSRSLHSGSNPWEREEREKDLEMRREHIRQWREQQISELSQIISRSPMQEEQLKTLILERDFERRAQEAARTGGAGSGAAVRQGERARAVPTGWRRSGQCHTDTHHELPADGDQAGGDYGQQQSGGISANTTASTSD